MSSSGFTPFPPFPRMFSPPPNSPNVSSSSPPPPPPPPPPPSSSGGSPTALIAVLVVVAVVVVGLAVGGYFFILRKKKNQLWSKSSGGVSDAESPKQLTHGQGAAKNLSLQKPEQASLSSKLKNCMSPKNTTLSYEELLIATNGFSKDNLLGEGGFGPVFKGVINGRDVAVKKLKDGSHQGDREFQAEVETISRVHHKHLVSLVGYCITEDERLLAYEFVPNQTLDRHLSDKGLPPLEWSKRLKIALGSAKGLAYLHEDCYPKTIHRDIKSDNILLDFNFEPKVADFGLAKQTSENVTHVSTRIMGTFGYLAPEYGSSGKLTDKSDVFSFGVVLLELITGRKAIDNKTMIYGLVDWARPLIEKCTQEDNYDEIVDQRLLPLGYNKDEMRRMVACADACVRQTATQRPPLCLIVKVLEGDVSVDELQDGIKLGPSRTNSPKESIKGKTQDNNEMGEYWKLALKSDVFSTTEHPSV